MCFENLEAAFWLCGRVLCTPLAHARRLCLAMWQDLRDLIQCRASLSPLWKWSRRDLGLGLPRPLQPSKLCRKPCVRPFCGNGLFGAWRATDGSAKMARSRVQRVNVVWIKLRRVIVRAIEVYQSRDQSGSMVEVDRAANQRLPAFRAAVSLPDQHLFLDAVRYRFSLRAVRHDLGRQIFSRVSNVFPTLRLIHPRRANISANSRVGSMTAGLYPAALNPATVRVNAPLPGFRACNRTNRTKTPETEAIDFGAQSAAKNQGVSSGRNTRNPRARSPSTISATAWIHA